MDINDNDNGIFRLRDEYGNIGNDCNVWQFHKKNHNPEQNRQEPFRENINLVMSNTNIICSHTAGVLHRLPFNTNS